jgi:hypothetical protein
MKKRNFVFIISLLMIFIGSCSQQRNNKELRTADNGVLQQADGTVSLKLDKAECYSDEVNPSNNTAEWKVVISKPGRFKVWLSSAAKDTTGFKYTNSVRISLLDEQLLGIPACDSIVHNSGDVSYPYFRTDSYMGSFYLAEPGEYNIQVISDKVIAKNNRIKNSSQTDDIKMMSVILVPMTR